MAKVILNDTTFNRFARRKDLDDLHVYLREIAKNKRDQYLINFDYDQHLDPEIIEPLNEFIKKFSDEIDFIGELASFSLRAYGNSGQYRLTLMYPTSKLTLAKKLFNTLGSNKCTLKDLRGKRVSVKRVENFHYEFDIDATTGNIPNGGVYNLAMLVYILVHFKK